MVNIIFAGAVYLMHILVIKPVKFYWKIPLPAWGIVCV